jgi:Putative zinc-finger
MECIGYRDVMLDVLYGEAAPETAKRLEEHIAVCGECREELAAFRRLRTDLGSLSLPVPQPARVAQRLGQWPRGALAAAAAAALLLGGWLVHLERRLAVQESRHAAQIATLEAALGEHGARLEVEPGGGSEAIQRVEAMLRASEERQDRRVEESLRALAQRTEAQRRYDLARVSAGLAYLDGRTGQHMARTTELMGHVLQVADQK